MAIVKSKAITGQKPFVLPDDATAEWAAVEFEFPTAAPAIGDLWEFVDIPIGYKVPDWFFNFPDVDSGAGAFAGSLGIENALATDLGTEVWAAGITPGQTTAIVRASTNASMQGDSTVQRRVTFKVTAAASTWAGAGKTGYLLLQLQG